MSVTKILSNNFGVAVVDSWKNSLHSRPLFKIAFFENRETKDKEPDKWPFRFTLFASIQFIILTTIAMITYPGGSIIDRTGLEYPFFRAFYSELGMTVTSGGKPNLTSAFLFALALIVAGLGIAIFYVAIPRLFRKQGLSRLISIVGSIFGVMSGVLYIAVAWTPVNLFLGEHFAFAILASQAFLIAVLCHTIAIFIYKKYPKTYGVIYMLFALLLMGYLWLSTYGPGIETSEGFIIQATLQKVIICSAIVCKIIQNWGAIKQEE